MIDTTPLSRINCLQTDLNTELPTRVESIDTDFPIFSSIIDSMTSGDNDFEVRRVPFGGFVADIVELRSISTDVEIISVAEALISSPETDFKTYEVLPASSERLVSLKLFYGVIPKILFMSVGNESFLSIDGKFLTLKS